MLKKFLPALLLLFVINLFCEKANSVCEISDINYHKTHMANKIALSNEEADALYTEMMTSRDKAKPVLSEKDKQKEALMQGILEARTLGMSQEDYDNMIQFRENVFQQNKKARQTEPVSTNPSVLEMNKMKQLLDSGVDLSNAGNWSEIERNDPKTNAAKVYKLKRDLAHFGSAEQAVVDNLHMWGAKQRIPITMSPTEATSYSREKGFDFKFDKPISKGELDYMIEQEKIKQDAKKQLDFYTANGKYEYTTFQVLKFIWAEISGSMGSLIVFILITSLLFLSMSLKIRN